MSEPIPVFDGHNDILGHLATSDVSDPVTAFLTGSFPCHVDLPKARAGGFAGGMFAVFCPSPKKPDGTLPPGMAFDMAPLPLDLVPAQADAIKQISLLYRLQAAGALAVCRSTAEIKAAMAAGKIAAVLHLEGVEAVDADLQFLDVLYAAGLRSLGPVWSRDNIFGHGVPFNFPGSPDTGPGLTDAGRRLVEACNRLGILVDLSHITEKGFWDVAEVSTGPLVATHSNVHAICPSPRNLTAGQLRAIADSDGMVGLNFATGFLRPDGAWRTDTDIEIMLRHLDAMIEAVGETRVGLGSDFDGAMLPAAIGSSAGLQMLIEAMSKHGYGEALIKRLAHGNWLALLERVIDR
ncbi:membrane dipeptidase [Devosia yakushimensis]|uniref:Membrane dipeptidase n=1 Tax=Devosia yakushimensis TaxID=470028 RepID=A0ABQ5UJK8_9HYPH|nr:dipeptidase [Devosia yakushimensis]GLQ11834.1 membrane dipeptidase [Devosia yakushimensis]